MKNWASSIGFTITVLGLFGMAVYLIMNNHIYFAIAFIIAGGCVRFRD